MVLSTSRFDIFRRRSLHNSGGIGGATAHGAPGWRGPNGGSDTTADIRTKGVRTGSDVSGYIEVTTVQCTLACCLPERRMSVRSAFPGPWSENLESGMKELERPSSALGFL